MTDLKIAFCSHEAAKYACENYHYSKCTPKGKLVKIGVWEDGRFIGAVIFGDGANNNMVKPYGLKDTEGCELVRVALKHHQSPVTMIISRAITLLKSHCPLLKLIVSYADPDQGHLGIIYQAGNWIYCGRTEAPTEYLVKGKRMHGRSYSNLPSKVRNHPDVQIVKGSCKYRYLYPLDKKTRKLILPLSLPYPKPSED